MAKQWCDLTSNEIKKYVEKGWTSAILAMGAIEQHGPHLACNYDTLIAERLVFNLSNKLKAFILPSFQYGFSDHHIGFFGTISIRKKTILLLIEDIINSLIISKIKKLYIVNGHGGNYSVIEYIEKKYSSKIKIVTDGNEKLIFQTISELSKAFKAKDLGLHAGLFETSLALYSHPESVRFFKRVKGIIPSMNTDYWKESEIKKIIRSGLSKVSKNGVIGMPKKSSYDLGKYFYKILLKNYKKLFF